MINEYYNSTLERLARTTLPSNFSGVFSGVIGYYNASVTALTDFSPQRLSVLLSTKGWTELTISSSRQPGNFWLFKIKGAIQNANNFNADTIRNLLRDDLRSIGVNVGSITVELIGGTIRATASASNSTTASTGNTISTGGQIAIPVNTNRIVGNTYIIAPGDTLAKISAKTGVSISELARLNGITNINLISVGQQLRLGGTANANNIPQTVINNSPLGNSQTAVVPGALPDNQNWFDRTFFTGAGTLSALYIGAIIVVGAVIVNQRR